MKKTQFIELIKNIQKTMVSFVSIIFFVMLGTTLFLGIGWCTKAFSKTLDKTLNDTNVHDIEIIYPYGLTNEAIDIIKGIDGVDKVEGIYSTEAFFKVGVQNYQAKLISLTEEIDTPFNRVGDLPLNKGEIAFERFWAENHNVNIGDTIVFKHDDERTASINDILKEDLDLLQKTEVDKDGMNKLNCDTFKVVGLYENGTYISQYTVTYGVSNTTGIPNDCIAYVSKDSFDEDAMSGYSAVEVLSYSLHKDIYDSDEYKSNYDVLENNIKEKLSPFTNSRFKTINNSLLNIKNDAHKELDDAIEEYEDGVKKIEDGEKQIKKGKVDLANGKIELENGQKQIDDGYSEYRRGLDELNKGIAQLNDAQNTFNLVYDGLDGYKKFAIKADDIKAKVTDFHNKYEVIKTIISFLPDDYILQEFDSFYSHLEAGEYDVDIDKMLIDYSIMIDNIKSNPAFESFEKTIENYENYIATLPDGDTKTKLQNVIDDLRDILDDTNEALDLPQELFDSYKFIRDSQIDNLLEQEIIDELDEMLKNEGYNDFRDVINILQTAIDMGFNSYEELAPSLYAMIDLLDDGIDTIMPVLDDYKAQINNAWAQINDGRNKLNSAKNQLEDAQNQLNEGWDEYYKNVKLLNNKEKELNDGKKELADAAVLIEEGKEDIKELDDNLPVLEEYDSSFLGRNSNAGVASASVPSTIMDKVKYTMALLFVLVGAFVCYSALSRIVYEQTVQIGTKKALGFNSKEITSFYILYAFVATTVGSILGTLLARFIVEPLILSILAKNYIVNELASNFDLIQTLLFYLFELSISIGATLLACNRTLKRKTTELLTNQNETLGKKRFFEDFKIWKNTPLLIKTIINNCLNDSRRVLSTVIGIIGCCSLMVCAITLIQNMYNSFDYQMENVSIFDTVIYFDSENKEALNKISIILDSKNIDYATASNSNFIVKSPENTYLSCSFFSYDDDHFKDFFHVAVKGTPITDTNGVYLSKAYSINYGLKAGDNITFLNASGEEKTANIAGVFDYYLLRGQLIVPKEYYEEAFGESFKANSFVFNRGNLTINELYELFNNTNGFISCFDYAQEAKDLYSSLTDSLLIIVITFFVLSVILALLVLLNLMIMFVDEKKRELIVLMINGFSRADAKKYIYGDTIFLTIIGSLLGIILGAVVGLITLKSFDSECVTIMRELTIPSYLLCALGTALLCAFTCIIALRKIDKFDLTDINKA